MTPRAVEEVKSNQRTDDSFDFPETSDMCDFGYVLIPVDNPTAPTQTEMQSSK